MNGSDRKQCMPWPNWWPAAQRGRDEVMAYFLQLFRTLERKPSGPWTGLAHACTDLWQYEVREELNRAYEDGLVDSLSINWQDIERVLALGKDGALEKTRKGGVLIDDIAWEMGWMVCFQKREHYKSENVYKSEKKSPG